MIGQTVVLLAAVPPVAAGEERGERPPGGVQLPAQLLALGPQRVQLVVARLSLGGAVGQLLLQRRHLALALANRQRRRLLE